MVDSVSVRFKNAQRVKILRKLWKTLFSSNALNFLIVKRQVYEPSETCWVFFGERLRGNRNRGNRPERFWEGNLPLRGSLRGRVFRNFQRFLEVFQMFFRGPLRDPLRGRFPSQILWVFGIQCDNPNATCNRSEQHLLIRRDYHQSFVQPDFRAEQKRALSFVVEPEFRIQYTYTYVKDSEAIDLELDTRTSRFLHFRIL